MWFKDLFKKQEDNKEEKPKLSLYEEALEKLKNNEKKWVNIKTENYIYKNYLISNYGEIFDIKRNNKVATYQLTKRSKQKGVTLYENKKKKTFPISKLMGLSFEIPNENNARIVRHIKDNGNDRLDNLIYSNTKIKERGIEKMKEEKKVEYKSLYDEGLEKLKRNEEMFLDVKGSDKYQVSNFGRVINKFTKDEISLNKVADTQSPTIYLRDIKGATTTSVSKLVAEAFEIPNPQNSKLCYHIGNIKDNRLDNLTYDRKETEVYIEEQRKIKEEQERIEREKEEHKNGLLNYIEDNKEFLKEAKAIADFKESIKKDITIEDVYNKLCEILEVLKK